MNNLSTLSHNFNFSSSDLNEENQELLRVIVFPLGDYFFALPINAVLQVIESPPELTQHFEGFGLVMLEKQSITLLNLHRHLRYKTEADPQQTADFLILTQSRQGEFCGIPIYSLPNMMELPYDEIQPLPTVYRQTNLYGIARFVTFVKFEEQEKKEGIYLLDVDEALRFLS
ncbi:CheW domain protein [Halothece sp. PCC 7418]|uniref:chemotaxis protein CheW n=1 Tax=Halothece sp. (strain PCC 7418) TaxID=65093 RepID=UPI0002A07442|nr:chemotaxis protein CheW [Halothece sp. PCC 7418]AFZ42703.1 CheW domain protein [Halothece sp. PCC 7418]